jgi:hypothetical protein
MKHLFLALMKILQCDVVSKEQANRVKESIRKIEKSSAGDENILVVVREWLENDTHLPEDANDLVIASHLINSAAMTSVCREDLEANFEKLKSLKFEHTAYVKQLRQTYEERKSELAKERMRVISVAELEEWKTNTAQLEKDHKDEMKRSTADFWSESRRLMPRTGPLGMDVLGNRYWVFSSRKTKEREFGGWVVIQTPGGKGFPGENNSDDPFKIGDEDVPVEEEYQDMKSWYYIDKLEDIKRLVLWTTYLAAKASIEHDRKIRRVDHPTGSPNRLGQSFAVEIPIKGPVKARTTPAFTGIAETKALCDELLRAAEWIEEKYVDPRFKLM